MAKLLKGKSNDIIKQNQTALCSDGMGEAQAWHLALKHANKSSKSVDRAVKGVTAKNKSKVKVL